MTRINLALWGKMYPYAGYLSFVLLSIGILVSGMRLDRANLQLPLNYYNDALLILPMAKTWQDGGTHWHNDRLGYPGIQELYDFPIVDHLHFLGIWVLGNVFGDVTVGFNLYYLATYPLTTFTAMVASRRLGLSLAAAGCLGILYAFLPYHLLRCQYHYFLSCYFLIPPVMVWAIEAARGDPHVRWWTRVSVAILVSCAGAYYAFFSCLLLAFGGLYGTVAGRRIAPVISTGVPILVIVSVGLLQHIPTYLYQTENGKHSAPTSRRSSSSEAFGLKITSLVLPIHEHRIHSFRRTTVRYQSDPSRHDNIGSLDALGIAGSIGLALGIFFVFNSKDWHGLRAVGAVLLFALLYSTVGGLGSMFSHWITPQIRALDRMSIFIAFAALFTFFRTVDAFYTSRRGWVRHCRIPVLLVMTAGGLLDSTDSKWFTGTMVEERAAQEELISADRDLFRTYESHFPDGRVFMLPHMAYPEIPAHQITYEHGRGYLFTDNIRWSYGAMRGREVDQLHAELARMPVESMIRRLVLNGFTALYLDRRGFVPTAGEQLVGDIQMALGAPFLIHKNKSQMFWDLSARIDRIQGELGVGYQNAIRAETGRVRCTWLRGFDYWPPGQTIPCESNALMSFYNPAEGSKTVTLTFTPVLFAPGKSNLSFESAIWNENFPVTDRTLTVLKTLAIPPGRTLIRISCPPPEGWKSTSGNEFVLNFNDVSLKENP